MSYSATLSFPLCLCAPVSRPRWGTSSFSSFHFLDRFDRRRDIRNYSAEFLFQSAGEGWVGRREGEGGGIVTNSDMMQGCPLFDVVCPAFPLPTRVP